MIGTTQYIMSILQNIICHTLNYEMSIILDAIFHIGQWYVVSWYIEAFKYEDDASEEI
jgi:hypothetical protein